VDKVSTDLENNSGENEMSEHEYLREWITLIQEYKLNCEHDDDILEKLGEKNYRVLYHELESVETQYLQVWEKFTNSEAYRELFLGNSAYISVLYLEFDRLDRQIGIGIRPLHDKQTKILFKRIKIEQEYENTNEIFKERNKLSDEKNYLYNKRIREESNLLLPESISQSRLELKTTRKEFLQSWKRYMKNPTFEKEFLECSDNYAQRLSKITTQKTKIRNWEKTKPYNKMLRENYIRYSILGDRLMDSAGEIYV
jgi:hypothetical protein